MLRSIGKQGPERVGGLRREIVGVAMSYGKSVQASQMQPGEGSMDQDWVRLQLESLHAESFGWAMCCCRRDRFRAEETLQRAYLKVLSEKARYRGTGAFKTWFFAVIRTTARDEARREWVRRICFGKYAAALSPAGTNERHEFERDEIKDHFAAGLAALPSRQREVMQLVFYHDLTLVQAALAMGVSIGSARTHYDRGKRSLRKFVHAKFVLELCDGSESPQSRVSLVF